MCDHHHSTYSPAVGRVALKVLVMDQLREAFSGDCSLNYPVKSVVFTVLVALLALPLSAAAACTHGDGISHCKSACPMLIAGQEVPGQASAVLVNGNVACFNSTPGRGESLLLNDQSGSLAPGAVYAVEGAVVAPRVRSTGIQVPLPISLVSQSFLCVFLI